MISLDSFSSYDHFARANIKQREFCSDSQNKMLFQDDLKVIQDFTTQLVPRLLSDIFYFFDSFAQVPIDSDRKKFVRKFDLTDDDSYGKKLEYEDCSIILDSVNPFLESKTKFAIKDFQYYTINLESDGNYFQQPRSIFIRGALTADGKYDKDLVLQFSYTNFDNDGVEDGIVIYNQSEAFLEEHFNAHVPKEQNFAGGAFILDINRPFVIPKEAHSKQMLLLKSGFALRTV